MTKQLRAAGYCRTSGEGQRDNTSIPRQQEDVEAYCKKQGWRFVRHYIDESRSGSKVEGRDAFQQMMRDAASGQFDVIVVHNISRFGRNGADIIDGARTLKRMFGVEVVDTKQHFDTRDPRNTLLNFVHAGVSEHERLSIMERTIGARVKRAEQGLPWSGEKPWGREFQRTAKNSGTWIVSEKGQRLRSLLQRYAEGEPLAELVREYGFSDGRYVYHALRSGQLSGKYAVVFNTPDIGIVDVRVEVPGMPEVISPALEKRVRSRLKHNRTWNKQGRRTSLLTGFVHCAKCGYSLTGQLDHGVIRYRHPNKGCGGFASIKGDELEPGVLDYVYGFFLDEPAFAKAIQHALPSIADREKLEREHRQTERQLRKVEQQITRLVEAIAEGASASLLLKKQSSLVADKDGLQARLKTLETEINGLPDPQVVQQRASLMRVLMVEQYKRRDWRQLPQADVRRFLHFLFGDDPKAAGHGVFVERKGRKWVLTFKGCVQFHHSVEGGTAVSRHLKMAADRHNQSLEAYYRKQVAAVNDDLNAGNPNRFVPTPGFDSLSTCVSGDSPTPVPRSDRNNGSTPHASASS